jgi:SAM-dependent methyltransferase
MTKGREEFSRNVERWTTMPAGQGRANVEDLMKLDGNRLLNTYFNYAEFWSQERGWEHKKYSKLFSGLDVVEVGSGFGFDGLMFSKKANSHTYVDINPKQINFLKKIIGTISENLKPIDNIKYEVLNDPLNQDFGRKFSALYSHGVLHHVPLDFAKSEFKNFDSHLEVGSPVILLMYPKTRWEDCGRPSFEVFGNYTDGGCPWAEYYDEEKIMELVGENYELKETIPWGLNNREFINFELVKVRE